MTIENRNIDTFKTKFYSFLKRKFTYNPYLCITHTFIHRYDINNTHLIVVAIGYCAETKTGLVSPIDYGDRNNTSFCPTPKDSGGYIACFHILMFMTTFRVRRSAHLLWIMPLFFVSIFLLIDRFLCFFFNWINKYFRVFYNCKFLFLWSARNVIKWTQCTR